jgi:hypothetical protein
MVTSKIKAKDDHQSGTRRQKHGQQQEQGKSIDNRKSKAKAWSTARAKQKHGHQQEQGKSMVTSQEQEGKNLHNSKSKVKA